MTKCGRVIAKTLGLFGGLDIVVNAATIHRFGTVLETDPDTWKQCMVMNVGSMYMYLMAHLGVPEMKKRGRGPFSTLRPFGDAHASSARRLRPPPKVQSTMCMAD